MVSPPETLVLMHGRGRERSRQGLQMVPKHSNTIRHGACICKLVRGPVVSSEPPV